MSKKAIERRNTFERREVYKKCGFFNVLRNMGFDYIRHGFLTQQLLSLGKNEDTDGKTPIDVRGDIKEFEARAYANWIRNKGWEGFLIEDGCRLFNREPHEIMEWVTFLEHEYKPVGLYLRYAYNAVPINIAAVHESAYFNDEKPFDIVNRKIRPPFNNMFLDFGEDVDLQDDGGMSQVSNLGMYLVTDYNDDDFTVFVLLITLDEGVIEIPFIKITSTDGILTVQHTVEGHRGDHTNHCINTMFFALELMNCRNLVLVDDVDTENVGHMYERQFGIPMTKYKTLAIKPMGKHAETEREAKDYQGLMPLHLRRGNFAHYTDDKPLFGKYTGTFWRPATAVGEKKNGVVVKDYEVKAS